MIVVASLSAVPQSCRTPLPKQYLDCMLLAVHTHTRMFGFNSYVLDPPSFKILNDSAGSFSFTNLLLATMFLLAEDLRTQWPHLTAPCCWRHGKLRLNRLYIRGQRYPKANPQITGHMGFLMASSWMMVNIPTSTRYISKDLVYIPIEVSCHTAGLIKMAYIPSSQQLIARNPIFRMSPTRPGRLCSSRVLIWVWALPWPVHLGR